MKKTNSQVREEMAFRKPQTPLMPGLDHRAEAFTEEGNLDWNQSCNIS